MISEEFINFIFKFNTFFEYNLDNDGLKLDFELDIDQTP